MHIDEPAFTKHTLARQIFVKTFYKMFYKNPTDGLVEASRRREDGSPHIKLLF